MQLSHHIPVTHGKSQRIIQEQMYLRGEAEIYIYIYQRIEKPFIQRAAAVSVSTPPSLFMGRKRGHYCCWDQTVKRGLWSSEEDEKLISYINNHGPGKWSSLPKQAGLQRCGKSCRLRWINYLSPDVKKGPFSAEEEIIITHQHRMLGNKWSQIAKQLPGRTDNDIKNFWNTCIKKKLQDFEAGHRDKRSTCVFDPPRFNPAQPFDSSPSSCEGLGLQSSLQFPSTSLGSSLPVSSQPMWLMEQNPQRYEDDINGTGSSSSSQSTLNAVQLIDQINDEINNDGVAPTFDPDQPVDAWWDMPLW